MKTKQTRFINWRISRDSKKMIFISENNLAKEIMEQYIQHSKYFKYFIFILKREKKTKFICAIKIIKKNVF